MTSPGLNFRHVTDWSSNGDSIISDRTRLPEPRSRAADANIPYSPIDASVRLYFSSFLQCLFHSLFTFPFALLLRFGILRVYLRVSHFIH